MFTTKNIKTSPAHYLLPLTSPEVNGVNMKDLENNDLEKKSDGTEVKRSIRELDCLVIEEQKVSQKFKFRKIKGKQKSS